MHNVYVVATSTSNFKGFRRLLLLIFWIGNLWMESYSVEAKKGAGISYVVEGKRKSLQSLSIIQNFEAVFEPN